MGKYLITKVNEYLNVDKPLVDFDSFPEDVRKTLEGEYDHLYRHNFDWNSKQDEYIDDRKGFNDWLSKNQSEEFIKNLDEIITKTRQDLILIKKKKNIKKALENFEDLIKPTLGKEVLTEPLSKYLEDALLSLHSAEEIQKAFDKSKEIIDSDGSIDSRKIEQSDIFVGGDISLPNFERFVEKNPEYKGVFDDWKKMFDMEMDLSLKDLHAFRNSTSYDRIRKLYDYLVEYRKKNKI